MRVYLICYGSTSDFALDIALPGPVAPAEPALPSLMRSPSSSMAGNCGHINVQSLGKDIPQVRKRQALRSACSQRPNRQKQRYHYIAAAAAVPVVSTSAPASSLLSAAVEKLFNFPPVYAAAVKQVSFLVPRAAYHKACVVHQCAYSRIL